MQIKSSRCTACGLQLDAVSVVHQHGDIPRTRRFDVADDEMPTPGESFTICIRCGHLMAFAADLTLRELTDAEAKAIAGDPRILAIQWARKRVMQEHGGRCPHGRPRMLCAECSVH